MVVKLDELKSGNRTYNSAEILRKKVEAYPVFIDEGIWKAREYGEKEVYFEFRVFEKDIIKEIVKRDYESQGYKIHDINEKAIFLKWE